MVVHLLFGCRKHFQGNNLQSSPFKTGDDFSYESAFHPVWLYNDYGSLFFWMHKLIKSKYDISFCIRPMYFNTILQKTCKSLWGRMRVRIIFSYRNYGYLRPHRLNKYWRA